MVVCKGGLLFVSKKRGVSVLTQRLRWLNKTRNESGTWVWQIALGTYTSLRLGKLRSMSVVRYLSSPSNSRFLRWRVRTSEEAYSSTISGFARTEKCFLLVGLGNCGEREVVDTYLECRVRHLWEP